MESDTESDTSGLLSSETVNKGKATFRVPSSSTDVPSFVEVAKAVETLSDEDTSSIVENKSRFLDLSEVLLHFLDRIPRLLGSDDDSFPEATKIFSQLGSQFLLQKLLDIRKTVRLAERVPGSRTTIITWVDVFLAKLEEVEWVQLRREDDTIRAATQLPDTWTALVAATGSTDFSPAARRLATTLSFTAYIMARQINLDHNWPVEGPSPLQVLHPMYLSINQATCVNVSPSVQGSLLLDKVQLAMLVSIFADAHSQIEPGAVTYSPHLRPEGFGHILEAIQMILGRNRSFYVLERPDPAQYILLFWGNLVPWSWSTWNDQRIANAECIRTLSATWFFHIHAKIHGTRPYYLSPDLGNAVMSDVFSSSLMILQLLKEILDDNIRNLSPCRIALQILCRLCWAAVQVLEANLTHGHYQLKVLIPELCDSLILVFPIIKSQGEEDNLTRSLIIEALTFIPLKVVSASVKNVVQNKQFLSNLDECMQCCIKLLCDHGGNGIHREVQAHFAKFLLNFSSILLQTTIDDRSFGGYVTSFVIFISQSVLRSDNRSLNKIIVASLLTPLSMLKNRKVGTIKVSDDEVWALIAQDLNQRLSVPAAFAYYLLKTSAYRRDSLLQHEAWNYLLGVLTRILDRQIEEEEELLALLISSGICLALRSIPCNITRNILFASPLALTMRLSMQELLEKKVQTEPYFEKLQERMRLEGVRLVYEMSKTTMPDADLVQNFERVPRLILLHDYYGTELVPVFVDTYK